MCSELKAGVRTPALSISKSTSYPLDYLPYFFVQSCIVQVRFVLLLRRYYVMTASVSDCFTPNDTPFLFTTSQASLCFRTTEQRREKNEIGELVFIVIIANEKFLSALWSVFHFVFRRVFWSVLWNFVWSNIGRKRVQIISLAVGHRLIP